MQSYVIQALNSSTLKSAHANTWFNPGPTCSDQALLPPLPNSAHAPRPAPPLNLAPPPLLPAALPAPPPLDLLEADPPTVDPTPEVTQTPIPTAPDRPKAN